MVKFILSMETRFNILASMITIALLILVVVLEVKEHLLERSMYTASALHVLGFWE